MEKEKVKPVKPFLFLLCSVLIGLITGLGAVFFRALIGLIHNIFFLGIFSFSYNANIHTPQSPWGIMVIFVPVAGALGVSFLIKNYAPEAKGHGVPEVMDAIYYSHGIIRPIVAVIKSVSSALSIGTGASIGREGPIVQIGATLGSITGQILKIPLWQRITFISAGAAGGIAATFNTPLGGLLFAIELMMQEVSVRTLVPVILSTATATYIGQFFFGDNPAFTIPEIKTPYFYTTNPEVLLSYAVMGIILGVLSAVFIRSLYAMEDFFDETIGGSYYRRHLSGMLLVGIMMFLFMKGYGHYYIDGVGYAAIQDILNGKYFPLYLLCLFFVVKLFATVVTLGSGASGGVFSPSLFMGATIGNAYGMIMLWLFPSLLISTPAFAVVGMAGFVSGVTGAALTAIVMTFEMTLDYNIILPLAITAAMSYIIRKHILSESIYTLKLMRRGHIMPDALQANINLKKRARDVMNVRFMMVKWSLPVRELTQIRDLGSTNALLVEKSGIVSGIILPDSLQELCIKRKNTPVGRSARINIIFVTPEETLLDILVKLHHNQSVAALVSDAGRNLPENIKGVITLQQIVDSVAVSAELFET